jgi:hypothetical protein
MLVFIEVMLAQAVADTVLVSDVGIGSSIAKAVWSIY